MIKKMAMKVEIISKEIIKPSSPTPSHLKSFELSFLDQVAPPVFVPIILFYTKDAIVDDHDDYHSAQCNRLKESLSKCLTSFYPLAGRLVKEDAFVDCNDVGVDFFEAKVLNCDFSDVIRHPNMDALEKLLPCEVYTLESTSDSSQPLLAIQVNSFKCGGIAIGLCISHKLADASSLTTFVKAWSAISQNPHGHEVLVIPNFELPSIFPRRDLAGFKATTGIRTKEKIATKRFVFNATSIASLKEKASPSNDSCVEPPTRVEVVSAFMSKCFIKYLSCRENKGRTRNWKTYAAMHVINLRKKRFPSLPEDCFGNMYSFVIAPFKEENEGIESMVGKIRAAIRGIDGEYVKKIEKGGDWYLEFMKAGARRVLEDEIELIRFSSWCRFGLYEIADFGWGKPMWVSTTTMPFKNVVILMDTRLGDGIEALVNMLEEDMAEFEQDQELLAFASAPFLCSAATN